MAEVRYFYIAPHGERPDVVILDGDEFHHCTKVCKVRVGQEVKLLDGRGRVYDAKVERIGLREAALRVLGVTAFPEPAPVDIALGVLKAPRLDFAIEKCTELGLRKLILFASARSVWRGDRGDGGARLDRMKRKVVAACKQSGQPYVPEIEFIADFGVIVERLPSYGRAVLADRDSGGAGIDFPGSPGAVLGIVGPEGGLSPEERDRLVRRGAVRCSLGPSRLRSETAAVCLLCLLATGLRGAHPGS